MPSNTHTEEFEEAGLDLSEHGECMHHAPYGHFGLPSESGNSTPHIIPGVKYPLQGAPAAPLQRVAVVTSTNPQGEARWAEASNKAPRGDDLAFVDHE